MPNLGAIGSNAIFCEYFSGLGLGRPILPGAEDVELRVSLTGTIYTVLSLDVPFTS